MASVNLHIILGNVGKDPEVRYTTSGNAVCELSIATTEKWKDKNTGELQEQTTWHRVVFWGRQAEVCGEYVKKGNQIYVEGQPYTDEWEDKEGNKRYTGKVRGTKLQLIGGKPPQSDRPRQQESSHNQAQGRTQRPQQQREAPPPDDFEDDVPFN